MPHVGSGSQWIESFWALTWNLPQDREYRALTLPSAAVHLTVERGDTRDEVAEQPCVITGVQTRRFEARIRGSGTVVGLKFRPGGLTALCGVPAHRWNDRTLPAPELLGHAVCERLATLEPGTGWAWTEPLLRVVDELAGGRSEEPGHRRVLEVCAQMLVERPMEPVDRIAAQHGMSTRTLQRQFRHYVGVGPKWLQLRHRLHDAVEELNSGYAGSITDLAHRLGWYDQAHFTRDFSGLVGETPKAYRQQIAAGRTPL